MKRGAKINRRRRWSKAEASSSSYSASLFSYAYFNPIIWRDKKEHVQVYFEFNGSSAQLGFLQGFIIFSVWGKKWRFSVVFILFPIQIWMTKTISSANISLGILLFLFSNFFFQLSKLDLLKTELPFRPSTRPNEVNKKYLVK